MKKTASLALAAMILALVATACASVGAHEAPSGDETLVRCRSRADDMFRARYTPKWEAYVDQCLQQQAR